MKRTYIFLIMCCLLAVPEWLSAQTGEDYCVRYIKEHQVYSDGDEVNVIDVDLEWPVVIDKADMRPLNTYLIKRLLGLQSDDFDASYRAFKNAFGRLHEGTFATLPDDRKFCYVDLQLKIIGHVPGRYVTFRVKGSCKPGEASSHVASEMSVLITYDLVGLRVLRRDDLLRKERLSPWKGSSTLELPVFVDYDVYTNLTVLDACLDKGGVRLVGTIRSMSDEPTEIVMSTQEMSYYMTKVAKSLLKGGKAAVSPCVVSPLQEWQGEPLYRRVDEGPRFAIEGRRLAEYISANTHLPNDENAVEKRGAVGVQLIIDKEGWTRDVRVVESLSPEYDRAVAQAARLLPRWTPAHEGGEPVNFCTIIRMEF